MRRNPFDDVEELLERVSRQVEGGMGSGAIGTPASVAIDVVDVGEEYVVTADLPGFETDDIDLSLAEGTLRLDAVSERDTEHEEGEYIRRERTSRSVSRRVAIPDPVEEEAVSATFNNGVLTVTLPKVTPDEGSKRIDIE